MDYKEGEEDTELQRPLRYNYSGALDYNSHNGNNYCNIYPQVNIQPDTDSRQETTSISNNEEEHNSSKMAGQKRERLNQRLIIGSMTISVIAIVISIIAIVMYSQTVKELQYARENQGE